MSGIKRMIVAAGIRDKGYRIELLVFAVDIYRGHRTYAFKVCIDQNTVKWCKLPLQGIPPNAIAAFQFVGNITATAAVARERCVIDGLVRNECSTDFPKVLRQKICEWVGQKEIHVISESDEYKTWTLREIFESVPEVQMNGHKVDISSF